jgi:O-antigen/teichoic acid export membrane protein
MKRYLHQLISESFVYGLSGVISRFLTIFLVPIYTRIFVPEDYGVMSLVTTTVTLISILVTLALDSSAHRWYWDTADTLHRKITLASWTWCQMTVSVIFAILVFAFSGWLGVVLIGRANAGIYFRLVAITIPLNGLNTVVTNWLRMQRRPWATMSYSLGITLVNILVTIILVVFLGWGLIGVYVAQILAGTIGTGTSLILLKDWVNPRRFQWSRLKIMLRYGFPLIPAGLAYWTITLSGFYFVRFFSSTSEVGLFQVGSTVASAVALCTGAFQQAWGPFALSIYKDPAAQQVYANVLIAYLWLSCFVSTAITLFASEILRLFTTEAYMGAAHVIGFLAFTHVMIGLGYIGAIGPLIVKTTKPYGFAVIVAALLTISLNLFLAPSFGKEGSAIASLAGQSFIPLYVFYKSQKMYPIPYRFGAALGILILALMLITIGNTWRVDNLCLEIGRKLLLISLFFPALFMLRVVKRVSMVES